mmetsp:Transcript_49249/g.96606  ORF Transcript_49249/g.96606 Transcript_49249/m.96606 type:complete len:320 (-) Transcript_49249:431-1390(-)
MSFWQPTLSNESFFLLLTFGATVVIQLSFFAIANTFKFDKVTDFAGALNFTVNAVLVLILGQKYVRQLVLSIIVIIWALRLGSFLLYRVLKRGKDDRFDEMRNDCCKFFRFWVFQMIWVWVVSLSVVYVNAAAIDVPWGAQDWIGVAVWLLGFVIETVADQTKAWHNPNKSKYPWLATNVWAACRHPNYFGEILCWVGVFISASTVFPANATIAYASVASPVFTAMILLGLSGAPLGEQRYDLRYGSAEMYWWYKERTPPVCPFFPSLYVLLPMRLKCIFCCEFPCYWASGSEGEALSSSTNRQIVAVEREEDQAYQQA